ncbi:MAG: tetratricopeptide repeat protein [Candidatus Kryptonium sp.]
MAEKKCKVCGTILPEDAKFCFNCGVKISDEPLSKVIICEICGFENDLSYKFCISCGSKLSGEVTAAEAPARKEVDYKVPETGATKKEKIEFKAKPKVKKKTLKVSFYQIFYFGLAVAFIGLIAYGIIRKEKSKTEVGTHQHQHPEVSAEVMSEIERLRQRVESNPDDMTSTLRLANLLHDAHMFEQAIQYYRKYLEKNESDPNARVDMGICLFEIGRTDEAIKEMEKALTYSPKHQLALYNLGIVNFAVGNIEKARDYFQRCVDVDSTSEAGRKAKRMLEQHKF